jgi:hypothetical protein
LSQRSVVRRLLNHKTHVATQIASDTAVAAFGRMRIPHRYEAAGKPTREATR